MGFYRSVHVFCYFPPMNLDSSSIRLLKLQCANYYTLYGVSILKYFATSSDLFVSVLEYVCVCTYCAGEVNFVDMFIIQFGSEIFDFILPHFIFFFSSVALASFQGTNEEILICLYIYVVISFGRLNE